MIVPRLGHTATILPDGKVLVTGGIKYVCLRKGKNISDVGDFLKSQEIYDPETGKFQLTKSLLVGHSISQTLQISQAEIFIIGSATDSLNSLRDPSKDSEIYNFITKKSKFVNNNSFNSKYVPAYYISPDKTLTYSIENPSGKNIGHYIHFYLFNQKTEKVEKQIRIYIPAKNYFTMDIGMFPDNNRLFCFLVSNRGFLRSLEPNYAFIYNIKENKYIPVGWFPDKSFNGYSMTPLSNGKQVLITGGVYWSQMRGLTKHSAWLYDPIKQGAVK